jgi:hypothetical protein
MAAKSDKEKKSPGKNPEPGNEISKKTVFKIKETIRR